MFYYESDMFSFFIYIRIYDLLNMIVVPNVCSLCILLLLYL